MRKLFVTTAALAALAAGAASAETAAKAGTDLNLRAGPGTWHEVIGTIKGGDDVTVMGCIESANWCEVSYDGKTGWAYGDYLAAQMGEEFKPLYPNRVELQVMTIEAPDTATPPADTAAGAAAGATAGALIAGPLGAVVGAAMGGTAAHVDFEPTAETTTYIQAHPVEPVMLDGEVVIGAGIPETVTLYEIPDQPDYRYLIVNGQPVLVNAGDRSIVYVYR